MVLCLQLRDQTRLLRVPFRRTLLSSSVRLGDSPDPLRFQVTDSPYQLCFVIIGLRLLGLDGMVRPCPFGLDGMVRLCPFGLDGMVETVPVRPVSRR